MFPPTFESIGVTETWLIAAVFTQGVLKGFQTREETCAAARDLEYHSITYCAYFLGSHQIDDCGSIPDKGCSQM